MDYIKLASSFKKILKSPTIVNNLIYTFSDVIWKSDRFVFTVDISSSNEPDFSYMKDALSNTLSSIIHSKLSQYYDIKIICMFIITINGKKVEYIFINSKDLKNILDTLNSTHESMYLILPDLGKITFDCHFGWSENKYVSYAPESLTFNFDFFISNIKKGDKILDYKSLSFLRKDISETLEQKSFNLDVADYCYEVVGEKLFGQNHDWEYSINSEINVKLM